MLIFSAQTTIKLVHKIIDIACDMPRAPLVRLTSYQHLIWAMDANKGTLFLSSVIRAANSTNSTITHTRTMSNAMAERHLGS